MPDPRRRRTKANAKLAFENQQEESSTTLPASHYPLIRCGLLIMVSFTALVIWFLFVQQSGGDSGLGSVKFGMLRGVIAPVRDDMHKSPFFVADIPGKGMGLLASRDIKQGELLIRETPLFVVPRETTSSPSELIGALVAQLSRKEQEAFFNLSYVNFPKHLDPDKHQNRVALAIFETNAVAAGDHVGIFPRMARLNHGCSRAFNAVYSWREKEKTLYVYALKSINQGEELLTSYGNARQPRRERRARLAEHYGFECQCSVCSLAEEESRASDERLSAISMAYGRLGSWAEGRVSGADAIAQVRKIWSLEDEEGYWSERGRLAADAAWVAASHSDRSATEAWARLAAEWYSYELGGDSEQAAEMAAVAADGTRHMRWGSRDRRAVGGPKP